jgi:DNA-nicking Smr family endonuclease
MAKRQLSDEDRALAAHRGERRAAPAQGEARAQGARRRRRPRQAEAVATAGRQPAARPAPPSPPAITVTLAPTTAAQAPDRRTATRLKRGQIALEAKLDLHGMTRKARRTRRSTASSGEPRARPALRVIVTGMGAYRGALREPGILRRSVPRRLAELGLRDAVASFALPIRAMAARRSCAAQKRR